MDDSKKRELIQQFIDEWEGCGNEKSDAQKFWLAFLRDVCGQSRPETVIKFEDEVKEHTTNFIDGYIPKTKVLIENKSFNVDLDKAILQSDGQRLTPYQQAKKYVANLELSKHPKWIVICNFNEFRIYDMEHPNDAPSVVFLKNLKRDYKRFEFLVDKKIEKIPTAEDIISIGAGEIIGSLYNLLFKQYGDDITEEEIRGLNILCVRLVFCLYAEDAGLFEKNAFHDYIDSFNTENLNVGLSRLFNILNTKPENIKKFDKDRFCNFEYVNGGLFEEEIEIPPFNDEARELLLVEASENFDWESISPSIFGTIFESTLDPKTRKNNGMHYTSVENILKVINPLFMDALNAEFNEIMQKPTRGGARNKALEEFHNKLTNITILDPACGSGNFLTVSYIELRKLENRIFIEQHKEFMSGQVTFAEFGMESANDFLKHYADIRVSIKQFYGIEINEFASEVARTAMWIAESQMYTETFRGLNLLSKFLPLKPYNRNIICANALQTDWATVVSPEDCSYIIGNPPFIGNSDKKDPIQKKEILSLFVDPNGKNYKYAGDLDYVAGWYWKACEYMQNTTIRTAFVSTNSITQGVQVPGMWIPLCERFDIVINFAYRTFNWISEATAKAHVHCVIIGFGCHESNRKRYLYDSDSVEEVDYINPYLTKLHIPIVQGRSAPLCNVPQMIKGFQPTDNGLLLFDEEERAEFLRKEPGAEKWMLPFISAKAHMNGKKQWCLWLVGITPHEINSLPLIRERVQMLRDWRYAQSTTGDAYKLRDEIGLMRGANSLNVTNQYVVLPQTSSGARKYIPVEMMENTVPNNSMRIVPNATLSMFGILTSSVHMYWMALLTGRMKSDYQYTIEIVFNSFPWPQLTSESQKLIEQTAQEILNARKLYSDSTLAELYDAVTLPPDLRKAHEANDRAVMKAFGFNPNMSEAEIIIELMKMYEEIVVNTIYLS